MPPPKIYHKNLAVRVTEKQSIFLDRKALQLNYKPSDYIRDLITKDMKR